jgi:hypothetical protein
VSTVRRLQQQIRLRLLVMIEVVGTVGIALMIILPLATGGASFSRDDLVPGLLLSLGVAFLGTWVLVLTLFDIARYERSQVASRASVGVGDHTATSRQRRSRPESCP